MKAKYQHGVFKPLEEIKDIKEGEVVEMSIECHEWNKLAMANPSFEFLKNGFTNSNLKGELIKAYKNMGKEEL
ncbi:antitoxin family protein [Candidatus Woesearchaeota archaeon]|nr:antitoxin family protein [Candidatus Woesearchaeota archaeon]